MANRDVGIIPGKTLPTLEVVLFARMQKRLYLYVQAVKLFPHIIFQIFGSFCKPQFWVSNVVPSNVAS
jgi:hypothetical protein